MSRVFRLFENTAFKVQLFHPVLISGNDQLAYQELLLNVFKTNTQVYIQERNSHHTDYLRSLFSSLACNKPFLINSNRKTRLYQRSSAVVFYEKETNLSFCIQDKKLHSFLTNDMQQINGKETDLCYSMFPWSTPEGFISTLYSCTTGCTTISNLTEPCIWKTLSHIQSMRPTILFTSRSMLSFIIQMTNQWFPNWDHHLFGSNLHTIVLISNGSENHCTQHNNIRLVDLNMSCLLYK